MKAVATSVKLKNKDPGFTEMNEKILNFKEKMAVVDRVAERLLVEQKGFFLCANLAQWSIVNLIIHFFN